MHKKITYKRSISLGVCKMKTFKRLSLLAVILTFFSCQNDNNSNVVSQKFIHKYGFDLSKNEWQQRKKEGTCITTLNNGVIVTNTYSNGLLHGPTTYSFANSSKIEKTYIYENGNLIKEISNDVKGIPYKEEIYEPNCKKTITLWDNLGTPISIEHYENDLLINGKYYKPDNELEAAIENGSGYRTKRERNGELLYKDKILNGQILARTTYHSNGQTKSTMSFHNYQLHGNQIHYSPTGEILITMNWNQGKLHGMYTSYKNANKATEIPYTNGLKNGLEKHYNDNGTLAMEIHWENDKKHGSHRIYKENETEIKWFYKGKAVSLKKFEEFSFREKLIADKEQFYDTVEKTDEKIALRE